MDILGNPQGALLLGLSTTAGDTILSGLGQFLLFRATVTQAAVAANNSIVEIDNPAASGKVAFFVGGDCGFQSAQGVTVVVDGTTINPAGAPVPAMIGGAASVMKVGSAANTTLTGTPIIVAPTETAVARYQFPLQFWYALAAGHNLQFQSAPVNAAFTVNLAWLELSA